MRALALAVLLSGCPAFLPQQREPMVLIKNPEWSSGHGPRRALVNLCPAPGSPLPHRAVDVPGCAALGHGELPRPFAEHGEGESYVVAPGTAADFRDALGCPAPAGLDFAKERVAVIRDVHPSSETRAEYEVFERDGVVHVVLRARQLCQGMAPRAEVDSAVLALPAKPDLLEVDRCVEPLAAPCRAP